MSHGFSVKRPNKTRRTFSIVPYSRRDGKKVYGPPLKHEGLTALNETLLRGLLTAEQADFQITKVLLPKIKEELGLHDRGKIEQRIGAQNLNLVDSFWEAEYTGRDLQRPEYSKNDLLRAVSFIEPLSLVIADRKELQRRLDATLTGTRHKRYGGRLNQLLTYIDRGFELHLKKRDIPTVHYLTWDELQKILPLIKNDNIRALAIVFFCSGIRLGEAFTLRLRDLKPNGSIFISKQMDTDLVERALKNRKPHNTILLPEGLEAFKVWAAVEDKARYRKCVQHPIINAARKAFPTDKDRQVSPHDLRHSFAIHMLGLGVPLGNVAKMIGDSIKTTEDYYAGYVMSNNEIDFVKAIIDKSK